MKYTLFYEPEKIYSSMLKDIKNAKKEILLETYVYDNDSIGKEFLKELIKKSSEGVEVHVLVDDYGSTAKRRFFKELIRNKGKVKFFKKFRYVPHLFLANHQRDHKKLLVIDKKISYIGSINITKSCINWRELVLRLEGKIALSFKKSFYRTWNKSEFPNTAKRFKRIIHKSFEILDDLPNGRFTATARTYYKLIRQSKKEILIITPYFSPARKLRMNLKKVINRGVRVKIIIPHHSDVRLVDLFRDEQLGVLYRMGVEIYFYPSIIHSKLLVIDSDFFLLGSSNLDYGSFMYQFEVNLLGKDPKIINSLKEHFYFIVKECKPFDYNSWLKKHFFANSWNKFLRWLFKNFEEYL